MVRASKLAYHLRIQGSSDRGPFPQGFCSPLCYGSWIPRLHAPWLRGSLLIAAAQRPPGMLESQIRPCKLQPTGNRHGLLRSDCSSLWGPASARLSQCHLLLPRISENSGRDILKVSQMLLPTCTSTPMPDSAGSAWLSIQCPVKMGDIQGLQPLQQSRAPHLQAMQCK